MSKNKKKKDLEGPLTLEEYHEMENLETEMLGILNYLNLSIHKLEPTPSDQFVSILSQKEAVELYNMFLYEKYSFRTDDFFALASFFHGRMRAKLEQGKPLSKFQAKTLAKRVDELVLVRNRLWDHLDNYSALVSLYKEVVSTDVPTISADEIYQKIQENIQKLKVITKKFILVVMFLEDYLNPQQIHAEWAQGAIHNSLNTLWHQLKKQKMNEKIQQEMRQASSQPTENFYQPQSNRDTAGSEVPSTGYSWWGFSSH